MEIRTGWVVEIDPRNGKSKKLIPLGRFSHESATVVTAKDGRPVVYMGDDKADECLYKFIGAKAGSLEKGEWIPLNIKTNKQLASKFKTQTDLLIRTREAAKIVGGTPLHRPEDIEIHPQTGTVFLTQTNNAGKGVHHGLIFKLEEENGDHTSLKFTSSTFLAGGESTGLSCPDNLVFDRRGNLWVTCDISGKNMNKAPYTKFKNNGLFFIPMSGKQAGKAFQVASAPTDAEFTGPCFTPDGETLLLAVQHPGELTRDLSAPTSHWPDGGSSLPSPAVLAISGESMKKILG